MNHQPFCILDSLTPQERNQQRIAVLEKWDLIRGSNPPVFDEATQTLVAFLKTPIAFLNLFVGEELHLKSVVGLARLGLRNEWAVTRKLPTEESFCIQVIDSQQNLAISDTFADLYFSHSILTQHYGIRSYLGAPLITSDGCCIGTLAVMDFAPRQFSYQELTFINLTARWCLGEFERDFLLKNPVPYPEQLLDNLEQRNYLKYIEDNKIRLVKYFTNELVNPLTSIVGMSSILLREVYGKLTEKQKEYLEVIHNSGKNMNYLVEQINNLVGLDENKNVINLVAVEIEMLCQQVINSLNQLATKYQNTIKLSIPPGNRTWIIDKEKSRQALYYLVLSVIEFSEPGGIVRIHVSSKNNYLTIAVWIEHPYLGNVHSQSEQHKDFLGKVYNLKFSEKLLLGKKINIENLVKVLEEENHQETKTIDPDFITIFKFLYSCHLVEIQGGEIVVQGKEAYGYRYILKLPQRKSG